MKKSIHILIKPASSECNMRCKYCFYMDVSSRRKNTSFGIMSGETVSALVRQTLAYAGGGPVAYAFQGGEPLIAGESFFHSFSETVDAYNTLCSPISYSLQTNGTLLTDSLCTYLKKRSYLVGVSLDGPRKLHDANRVFANGEGSFDRVARGIERLKKHGVPFNILTVLTNRTAEYMQRLQTFFEHSGFDGLQFITCLEPFGAEPFSSGFAMGAEDYFSVNKALFDWYWERNRTGRPLFIRHFDNMMRILDGFDHEMCGTLGYCAGQMVVEGNGNCYPCDFYCDDAHLLGNIRTNSLEEMRVSPAMKRFIGSSLPVDGQCGGCPIASLCRGGCRRERDINNDGILRLNIYCEGRRRFFEYVLSKRYGQRGCKSTNALFQPRCPYFFSNVSL